MRHTFTYSHPNEFKPVQHTVEQLLEYTNDHGIATVHFKDDKGRTLKITTNVAFVLREETGAHERPQREIEDGDIGDDEPTSDPREPVPGWSEQL